MPPGCWGLTAAAWPEPLPRGKQACSHRATRGSDAGQEGRNAECSGPEPGRGLPTQALRPGPASWGPNASRGPSYNPWVTGAPSRPVSPGTAMLLHVQQPRSGAGGEQPGDHSLSLGPSASPTTYCLGVTTPRRGGSCGDVQSSRRPPYVRKAGHPRAAGPPRGPVLSEARDPQTHSTGSGHLGLCPATTDAHWTAPQRGGTSLRPRGPPRRADSRQVPAPAS